MSTPGYPSMCICMCQHFSTQTHSYPEGVRQGVSFTLFQYKQHTKKLKSAIEPKAIPNIPTLASEAGCPQIFLNDYSQLTQSTFSTPLCLNSTAMKPYRGSHNFLPQDLGIITSSIISLRYNIPRRASCILTPSLNLLINSSI
ncbi:hypothetical protein O181_074165 [Austropuccinia psidii MF-1]|uniref:Uncharacterized protein n=1 Tax=Austropuccinia psidii MF-1 TaxID=1389203 RepID=A0A9Q3F403_9BASI|nr:hypothetical protein [Austropuccinia psidii MF-1]